MDLLSKCEIYETTYNSTNKQDVLKEIQERGEHLKILDIDGYIDSSELLSLIGNVCSSLVSLKLKTIGSEVETSDLHFISNLNQLKCLHLQVYPSISVEGINQILQQLSTLEELFLFFDCNRMEVICFPSTLKRLYFSSTLNEVEHVMNISDCCPDLELLHFHNFISKEKDFRLLEYLGEGCPNIISLLLKFSMGTPINFSFLRTFPNLKIFEFTSLSAIDPSDLFSMIPQIEELMFIHLEKGVSSKLDFSELPNLKALGFKSEQIGDEIISNMENLQSLEKIVIYWNSIDFFYKILPSLPNLTCVQLPNVEYNYEIYVEIKLLTRKRTKKLSVELNIEDYVRVAKSPADNFIVKKYKGDYFY